jgi:competence protein ComEA
MPRWLVPLLAGLGGAGLGVAVVGLVVLAVGVTPDGGRVAAGLEPSGTANLQAPFVVAPASAAAAAAAEIVVDVAGAVVRPGLHRLRSGDRVGDAIEAAGGFAPRADLAASSQSLNLAQPLEDGAKVLVPELGIDRSAGSSAGSEDGRIDINRAGQSELETLPGIGPVTAGKIIDAREDDRFDTVRELRSRGLVGEKVYEDIKGLVRAS